MEVLEHLKSTKFHLVATFRSDLITLRGEKYAAAIAEVSPLHTCIGFLDCVFVRTCRRSGRSSLQRSLYSGHKRAHGIKLQTITTPDGLCFHAYGAEERRRHDTALYRKSNMDQILPGALHFNAQQHCVFADSAYILRPWCQIGFGRFLASTEEEKLYDAAMSSVRVSVEWTYKDVRQALTMLDLKRKTKIKQEPYGLCWIGACLLWNLKVVLRHGSQAQTFFDCPPPSWEQYVNSESPAQSVHSHQ